MLGKLRVFIILIITCLLLVVGLSSCGGVHPDPLFNIGNGFDQKVTVHFQGQEVGDIEPGKSKIFYPCEVTSPTDEHLLVELKSVSGTILYSRLFTWSQLNDVLERVKGEPYWISCGYY